MVTTLYRPVGLKELELIAQTGFSAFPPRRPDQPIFYPVLKREYAEQIARDWNATSPPYAGFVLQFQIDQVYAARFDVHTVGKAGEHTELWIPAEELVTLNRQIIGRIRIVATYYGDRFQGTIDPRTHLPRTVLCSPEYYERLVARRIKNWMDGSGEHEHTRNGRRSGTPVDLA